MINTKEHQVVQRQTKAARSAAARARRARPQSVHNARLNERELLLVQARYAVCLAAVDTAARARSRAVVHEAALRVRLTALQAEVKRLERASGGGQVQVGEPA